MRREDVSSVLMLIGPRAIAAGWVHTCKLLSVRCGRVLEVLYCEFGGWLVTQQRLEVGWSGWIEIGACSFAMVLVYAPVVTAMNLLANTVLLLSTVW